MSDIRLFGEILLVFLLVFSSLIAIYRKSKARKEKIQIKDLKEKLQKKDEGIRLIRVEILKLEKKNRKLLTSLLKENQELRKEKCQKCKTVYLYMAADEFSFNEDLNKYSLPDESSDERKKIYYLENHMFIDFYSEDTDGSCYLINLISGLIYLPLEEWKETKGNELLFYRHLCSERGIHISTCQLL